MAQLVARPLLVRPPQFRSRALLDQARGRACVLCGDKPHDPADSTTVAAHLPGAFYRMPGGSIKVHDWLVAHLCVRCHAIVDSEQGRRDAQLRMMCLCLTLEPLFFEGVILVAPA